MTASLTLASSLYAYGIQHDSRLLVHPYGKVQRSPVAEVKLTAQLLNEIEHSPDPEYQAACRRLLNCLPSDLSVIQSLENMPAFLSALEKVTNNHIFVYRLQVLAQRVARTKSAVYMRFTTDLGAIFLVKILNRQESVFQGVGEVMQMMKRWHEKSFYEHGEVIPRLLTLFPHLKKHKKIAMDILASFLRHHPDTTTVILRDNVESLARAIAAFDNVSFTRFAYDCIQYIRDPHWMIGLCLADHPDASNAHYFFEVLREVVS
jgi:hypothetical protein